MSSRGARSSAVLSAALLALVCLVFSVPGADAGPGGGAVIVTGDLHPGSAPSELMGEYAGVSAEVSFLESEGFEVLVYMGPAPPPDGVPALISEMAESVIGEERFLDRGSFERLRESGTEMREPAHGPDQGFLDRMVALADEAGGEVREEVRGFAEMAGAAGFASKMTASAVAAEVSCAIPDRRCADEDDDDDAGEPACHDEEEDPEDVVQRMHVPAGLMAVHWTAPAIPTVQHAVPTGI